MTGLFNNVQSALMSIGLIIAVIGFIILGMKVILTSSKSGGGIREAFSGAGGVAVGIILIGAAGAIAGALMSAAKSL